VFVTTNIGIISAPRLREKPTGLLKSADLAMYRAGGKAHYEVFDVT